MTRFARAKGSKSSNERLPEEATSWQEMKEQMEQKKQEGEDLKKQKHFEEQRRANYKNFLDDCENEKEVTWAEFEDNKEKKVFVKKTKPIEQRNGNKSDDDDAPVEQSAKVEPKPIVVKKKKKKVKKGKIVIPKIGEDDGKAPEENLRDVWDKNKQVLNEAKDGVEKPKQKKKKKKKVQKVKKPESELTEIDKLKIKKSKEKKAKQHEKRKLKKAEEKARRLLEGTDEAGEPLDSNPKPQDANQEPENNVNKKPENNANKKPEYNANKKPDNNTNKNLQNNSNQKGPNNQKRKLKTENKEHKRRKPAVESVSMMINGNEVQISYFNGFPIKTEDATRLHELKKQMISRGIPRSEVEIALKLERRKAEKALTREKKKVCFNCRKSGHNLSECPNLNENTSHETIASGICFKCGSTEHTHFECKVVRSDNYKFATCFICKEQGHISKQCPDNNRGLYPKGGSCKVCGDVTHLKKDCLKYQAQQEALTMTADTIKFDDIEDLDGAAPKIKTSFNDKSNKVVKF